MNKNDLFSSENLNSNMKPVYLTNEELNCGVIKYNDKTYLVDTKDKDRIVNFSKKFVFVNNYDVYPSYCSNYKRFTYLDFIFSTNNEGLYYHFKNNNCCDLRRCNVEKYHYYHKVISTKYNVLEYINGHSIDIGVSANIIKNPLWLISENDREYLLMYCEKETICKLCKESYSKIQDYEKQFDKGRKSTWYKGTNGYIVTHNPIDGKVYYIHQIITGCYGNGKGTKNISVDHIDQDPLNNTWENLRIATREEQEQNCNGIKQGTKRERKHNAIKLPDGITHDMMRKYVVYYHEWLDKEHTREREFFKIETHPKLDKPFMTSKSNKITIQDKLAQANKIVDDLENDIYPTTSEASLPKYMSLVISRDKPHLVYERRIDGKRLNFRMILPDEHDIDEQIVVFYDKLKIKYPDHECFTSIDEKM